VPPPPWRDDKVAKVEIGERGPALFRDTPREKSASQPGHDYRLLAIIGADMAPSAVEESRKRVVPSVAAEHQRALETL
jgi:hypothetical protein